MHRFGDKSMLKMTMIWALALASANIAVLMLPALLGLSPASSEFWMLQREVTAPLQRPWASLGIFEAPRQIGLWLGLGGLGLILRLTGSAFVAGLLTAGLAIVSAAAAYAILSKSFASGNLMATAISLLMLVILSQVFIAGLRGFRAVSRSYATAMGQNR